MDKSYESNFGQKLVMKPEQKINGPPVPLLNKHPFFRSQCIKRQIFFLIYYQLGGSFEVASIPLGLSAGR